jgi:hypothetical protein
MVPWLGAGELLNLAVGWAPDDAGTGSSSPFPGVCAFRLTVPFGANAPYSLAAIPHPFSPDESWRALHCALRAGPAC